jgi:hypothetical protein
LGERWRSNEENTKKKIVIEDDRNDYAQSVREYSVRMYWSVHIGVRRRRRPTKICFIADAAASRNGQGWKDDRSAPEPWSVRPRHVCKSLIGIIVTIEIPKTEYGRGSRSVSYVHYGFSISDRCAYAGRVRDGNDNWKRIAVRRPYTDRCAYKIFYTFACTNRTCIHRSSASVSISFLRHCCGISCPAGRLSSRRVATFAPVISDRVAFS